MLLVQQPSRRPSCEAGGCPRRPPARAAKVGSPANRSLESTGSGAPERLGLREGRPGELNPRLVRLHLAVRALGASGSVDGQRHDRLPRLRLRVRVSRPPGGDARPAAATGPELRRGPARRGAGGRGGPARSPAGRARWAGGAHLDVSLQEAIAALNQSQFNAMERTGEVRRQATASASNPTVSLLPASDGWVAISPREEHQWAR